jgi:hypothetical protein
MSRYRRFRQLERDRLSVSRRQQDTNYRVFRGAGRAQG